MYVPYQTTLPRRQQALLFGSNFQCMYHIKQHSQEDNRPYCLGVISSVCTISNNTPNKTTVWEQFPVYVPYQTTLPRRQQALLFRSNFQCMYHIKQHSQEDNRPYCLGAISSVCTISNNTPNKTTVWEQFPVYVPYQTTLPRRQQALLFGSSSQYMYHTKLWLSKHKIISELRCCVKVGVAILGSQSLKVLMVSVDVKQD